MFYHINLAIPQRRPGGFGFTIELWPAWRQVVETGELNQTKVNHLIGTQGRLWLDSCGFDTMSQPPGPKSYPLYQTYEIQVSWGAWGPEHITVPGDACGLDICDSVLSGPRNGRVLCPHNVDTMRQAYLLNLIFSYFADYLILDEEMKNYAKNFKSDSQASYKQTR